METSAEEASCLQGWDTRKCDDLGLVEPERFCLPESSGSCSWSEDWFGFSLLWLEECLCVWAGLMVLDVGKGEFSRLQQHSDDCSSVAW